MTQAQHDRDTIEALRRKVDALVAENKRLRAIITEQTARALNVLHGQETKPC